MKVTFATRKLQRRFETQKELVKAYGSQNATKVMARIGVLKNARSLAEIPSVKPERCHPLTGDRKGQYAVDLKHPHRLIFEPEMDELPYRDDGGLDLAAVDSIKILCVDDYH